MARVFNRCGLRHGDKHPWCTTWGIPCQLFWSIKVWERDVSLLIFPIDWCTLVSRYVLQVTAESTRELAVLLIKMIQKRIIPSDLPRLLDVDLHDDSECN